MGEKRTRIYRCEDDEVGILVPYMKLVYQGMVISILKFSRSLLIICIAWSCLRII